jgi:hypothetical protein
MMQIRRFVSALVFAGLTLAAVSVPGQQAPTDSAAAMQYLATLPPAQRLAAMEREAKREGGFTI